MRPTAAQEAALTTLRTATFWKVVHLTTAVHGGHIVVVRLDRHRQVSRVTDLVISPDGAVTITAGPVKTVRRKTMKAPDYL